MVLVSKGVLVSLDSFGVSMFSRSLGGKEMPICCYRLRMTGSSQKEFNELMQKLPARMPPP